MRDYRTLFFGNFFEHFDKALFALLMPFIGDLFFKTGSFYLALATLFVPLEILFRPLGAYLFGKRADLWGRKKTYLISIGMTGVCSLGYAVCPSYATAGRAAVVMLLVTRGMMSFFSSMETSLAFLLSIEKAKRKFMTSAACQTAGMLGVMAATSSVLLLFMIDQVSWWRGLYLIGALGCFFVVYRSDQIQETHQVRPKPSSTRIDWNTFFTVVFGYGFSYANYFFLMTVIPIFLHKLWQFPAKHVLLMQLFMVALDVLLLRKLSSLIEKKGVSSSFLIRLMTAAVIISCSFFNSWTPVTGFTLLIARGSLLVIGVLFAIAFPVYIVEKIPQEKRAATLASGKAIGGQLIGSSVVSVCLLLYKSWQINEVFSGYIGMSALCAIGSLLWLEERSARRRRVEQQL